MAAAGRPSLKVPPLSLRPPHPAPPSETLSAPQLLSKFHLAFSLMSVIPLLICCYLITAKFFLIDILVGMNGVYFLLAVIFALLGLFAGRQLIHGIIQRLVETNAKLERITQRQSSFIGNVAHEFRAPMAVVKGALDNLVDGVHGPLSADQGEAVGMCQKEVNRLKRLVTDLLDLSRIESGKLPMVQQEVILQDVLTSVTKLYSGLLKERGLSLTVHLLEVPARVVGDRDRLEQVFVNLFTNAVKFTDGGGIRIQLTKDAERYQVEIQDTGRGIAAADLERIFDKFERVGMPAEEGSGLGLAIAKDIVGLHRGRIWVDSEVGKGSRFFVQLPAAKSP